MNTDKDFDEAFDKVFKEEEEKKEKVEFEFDADQDDAEVLAKLNIPFGR